MLAHKRSGFSLQVTESTAGEEREALHPAATICGGRAARPAGRGANRILASGE